MGKNKKQINLLRKSVKLLIDKGASSKLIDEEQRRLARSLEIRDVLEVWVKYPDEGSN
ncbi:hypothetical protein [Pseudooceanicola sp.]|uniref:hypothetical protein n=1 Tax=Pseudooceanicola sp. TaxID=1914328 RepID=UPI00261763CE|nr:hypothetical protein [Pseudooceanicola sp.]MDF1854571.1 hypothetical protein [Pseudooceanicola sp.]